MIRGKLATVIEKLDTDLGVQVNRSVWVARAQISYAQVEDSRRMSLILGNGDEVVVARPRLTLVKDCLRRWNIDLRDGVVSGTDAIDLDQAS
jgi:DNA-binding LytR/AlgR family response regulator